ncbi:SusC/RagA family TonB-linked outer membrane protein [Pedobacter sp. HX-22-1]|jgi:TonB-linked SusC/RagA family outer membrane protein|uniref:SusC/RagA family TonB-linked outer membrane protein n=1 Tax=Pedobacter puniceum TaxID=2666136 RepID=A0A7K0FM11_9SPHI|nr:SusC/RagA family TonB-linked outer membrane protein [Pedobacter puniceum]
MLVCFLLLAITKTHAQKISLSERKASLENIFQLIEQQTSYRFVFNTIILEKAKPVDIKIKNAEIGEVLDLVFRNQPLTYTIVKQNIILKEKEVSSPEIMVIYGIVTDEKGIGFPGARIGIKSKNINTITDEEGKYKLVINDVKDQIISFEALGYQKQEVIIQDNFNIDIQLKPDLKILEEIIIVGYGEVNKRDLTGSVGEVNMKDLTKAPVKSFDDAFAGRVAGVQVTSPDGQPGAVPTIIVRGGNSVTQDNSPLYVIDGFPIEDYNINAIHPDDIASIEVLKDASSTAIYGARGANGVVIVSTKKGIKGKSVFSFNNYYGLQGNTSQIELMKPYEFVKYQLELDSIRAAGIYLQDGKTLESYRNENGINWQDELFREAPMLSSYFAVRGGNKDNSYAFSSSLFDQKGTVIASGFKRYQARLVIEQSLNKRFKVGVNANLSSLKSYGTIFTGTRNTFLNILINTWQYRPIAGNFSLDELLNNAQDPAVASATNYQWNPVLTATNELRDRMNSLLTSNVYGVYDISNALKLRVTAGLNLSKLRNDEFNNSKTRQGSSASPLGQRGVNGAITFTELSNLINENTLTYQKSINKEHFFTLLSGFTIQENKFAYYGSGAIRIPNETLGIGGLAQGVPVAIPSQNSENRLLSFLGRLNYNYKSKYLFTGTFRADGSSKFTGNNQWGYFPSGSFAWNIAQEKFMQGLHFLSETKLRLSYGLTGNNRISEYAYYGAITQGGNNSYMPGGTFISGAYVSNLSNPDLKWESTAELDFGLDIGFLNQRFTLTADIYKKKTNDLLLNAQLPTSSGFSNVFQNIGAVENKGLELTLQSFNIRNEKIKWNTSFNISFNRTKLVGLAQNQKELLSTVRWNSGNDYAQNPAYVARIGQPVAMFYGFVWDGVYQFYDFDKTPTGTYVLKADIPNNGNPRQNIQPGDIKYKDINGDNVVDMQDRTEIGNPNPKFFGGLANNLSFKNFDVHVFLQFVYGNEVMNVNRYLMEGGTTTLGANQFASYQNRWTPENPSNEHFRTRGWGPSVYSSRVIEDGSFIRLKTINLGYKVENKLLQRLAISNFRVYVAAQNLITLTRYSGNDPEVSVFDSALTPGLDYSAYPRAKVVTLGLDISF